MTAVVSVFGALIAALSAYGLIWPRGYVAFARWFQAGPGVWGGFAVRLALAACLWLAAPDSATPTAFRVLAALAGLGGVFLPVLGRERFGRLVEWGAGQPPLLLRSLSALGLAFGLFITWSASTGG